MDVEKRRRVWFVGNVGKKTNFLFTQTINLSCVSKAQMDENESLMFMEAENNPIFSQFSTIQ